MRIRLITQDPFYCDDSAGVALARAVNHAHPATPNLVEDFVITEVPLRIRHVAFSHDAFESRYRYSGRQSLTQETTGANSRFESRSCATLLAFCGAPGRALKGIREPVRMLHRN